MRLKIIAFLLLSLTFAIADDNPYAVEAPKAETLKVLDTVKTVSKPTPQPADTAAAPKKKVAKSSKSVAKKDTVAVIKKDTAVVVKKDSVVVVKKDTVAAVKPAPMSKPASVDSAKVKTDSVKAPAKDTTVLKKKANKSSKLAAKKDSVVVLKAADTASKAKVDTLASKPVVKPADTTTAVKSAADTTGKKPRQKVVRETTINSINESKGSYRSPKRALFMSLVIPGLGQAYVGQSKFNYVRAAAYFATDVVLGVFWYEYVSVKHDREVRNYHSFADTGWSQVKYEFAIQQNSSNKNFDLLNPARETYCNAVVPAGSPLLNGCKNPESGPEYSNFFSDVQGGEDPNTLDSISAYRGKFPNTFDFYNIIGQEQEFLSGWKDANVVFGDSSITGTSAYRDEYVSMRARANRYARMQAWFLGGMVINHIASALDAALTARYHNRQLYETESMWYDRLHFDGGLVLDQGWPKTNLTASITF